MKAGRFLIGIIIAIFVFSMIIPSPQASAAELTAHQDFTKKVSVELNKYIKKSGGLVMLQYQDLVTGETFQIKGKTSSRAASTIKLPLALYIMEQAAKGKINLNQKLKYKSYHYYGGSGVIQKDKVGTSYTIRDLVKKVMIYSDNIAFIMLKERVGQQNFIKYMKSVGGKYAYPNGQNLTSAKDLTIYAKRLYLFSNKSPLGKELVGYLKKTVYNTTIPRGIKGTAVAHKVGMIPMDRIYNDAAIVYDKNPYVLAIMTRGISYEKSQKVIAGLAAIVNKHHKAKASAPYFKSKADVTIYQNSSKAFAIGTLKKYQTLKIISSKGTWFGVKFGKGTGYIEKKSVVSLKKATVSGWATNLPQIGIIKMKAKTPVVDKTTSGKVIAYINKNQDYYFFKRDKDYYVVDIGGRVGYVASKYITDLSVSM
ncbi:serine hydrolase [Neobacillus sp. SuZ13]|uniref:serine hydrolase n=1 Tax=Neobacillus sp. SuZ13 TaxID=3047875 RepID=UPI0024BF823A|nr:serine hydrolase [Neobacillus sp. SuZ13]WHY66373.1 serine hydrolase [Neobacillus sp. SuZ13]